MTLVDLKTGEPLGSVDGGLYITTGLFPNNDATFYIPETHYSRGSRGERTDVVTFNDTHTLAVTGEVIVPPIRAHSASPVGHHAITDNGQFIALFNMTPAQSISIVDTRAKTFVAEIQTPGCAALYGAGERRFFMLCGNGSLMIITLDEVGTVISQTRTEQFFDPTKDPIMEKGVRIDDDWYFPSFDGFIYTVNVSGEEMVFSEPWSLLSDADREDRWRVGGRQLMAMDKESGRLYILQHHGGMDTHKNGGTHMGVYNYTKRIFIERIALESPGFTFSGIAIEFGMDWVWPFNGLYNLIGRKAMEAEVHARPDALMVTGGAEPLLVVAGEFTGSLAVYDLKSLEFLYRVETSNWTTLAIQDPQWGN
jgi:methylamine dehydrogenase heavy chain